MSIDLSKPLEYSPEWKMWVPCTVLWADEDHALVEFFYEGVKKRMCSDLNLVHKNREYAFLRNVEPND